MPPGRKPPAGLPRCQGTPRPLHSKESKIKQVIEPHLKIGEVAEFKKQPEGREQ